MNKMPSFKRLFPVSLRFKITLYFGLMFATIITAVGLLEHHGVPFIGFEGVDRELTLDAFSKLTLIADLKKERLQRWVEERNDDLEILAKGIAVKANVANIRQVLQENVAQGKNDEALLLFDRIEETVLRRDLAHRRIRKQNNL